jgi:hypothetical protein
LDKITLGDEAGAQKKPGKRLMIGKLAGRKQIAA